MNTFKSFFISFLMVLCLEPLQADWSVQKEERQAVIVGLDKGRFPLTINRQRYGISGDIWEVKVLSVDGYHRPLLVVTYGFGVKAFELVIYDPEEIDEKKRVVFSVNSYGDGPEHQIKRDNNKKSYLEIVVWEEPDPNSPTASVQARKKQTLQWPKFDRISSK